MTKQRKEFAAGWRLGIPIMLAYLSVSFGFGILSVKSGLSPFSATLISAIDLTSAGQVAGVLVIRAGGTVIEMLLTQVVINLRYSLMAISLSQKADGGFSTPLRALLAFGITDEIYAMAISRPVDITVPFMVGLIIPPWIGWTSGTVIGALAGEVLPQVIADAMGILLYGMFIGIILPPAKKDKPIFLAIGVAMALSVGLYFAPIDISDGISVILCAIVAAALAAWLFPVKPEKEEAK